MTAVFEWPLVGLGLKWGKQALAFARFGAGKAAAYLALEARVTALEKLFESQPPDVCTSCGERKMRRILSKPRSAVMPNPFFRDEDWQCSGCEATEWRTIKQE